MTPIIVIFAVVIAAIGWHYTFYSVAGARLAAIEEMRDNRRRVCMRRLGGTTLLAMGILLGLGAGAVTPERHPRWFLAIWLAVLVLLILVTLLALLDLRLTRRLRGERSRKSSR